MNRDIHCDKGRDPRFTSLLARLAQLQAASWIVLLCVAMPVKYGAGHAAGVTLVGVLHGALWLSYMWVLLAMASLGMWRKGQVARLVLSTLIPLAGFATAPWIRRQQA